MFGHVDCLILLTCPSHHLAFNGEICQGWKPSNHKMNSRFKRCLALSAIILAAAIPSSPAEAASKETIAMSVGRLLEEGHYTRQKLNEEVSKKFLQTYLELLDFSHLFFTQKDIDSLNAKYGNSMAGDVLLG